jgi:triacylglycerol esterase/lipase EstA (alpha/beta hydrolase family)
VAISVITLAAYADRGDYNVFTVDWESLTKFPCYLSALSNTRLVAQCSAMLYSYLTHHGARATNIQCVGHSLGAHICGMMSRHLSAKMHKIIGSYSLSQDAHLNCI